MEIREAVNSDIPEIIKVLKISLGETKLPKSEKIWRYKHLENPFGNSLVIVAIINNKVIGVRTFMKWIWRNNGKEYPSLRAVDTAILPEFQRQGILQKLNKVGIELAMKRNLNFIFNTPNPKSLGANLKMDWVKIGKLYVGLHISNPKYWLFNYKKTEIKKFSAENEVSRISNLLKNYNEKMDKSKKMYTPKTLEFLKWRYVNNPLQEYEIYEDEDFFIAAYIKKHKYFNELRISEHIYFNEKGLRKIKSSIKHLNKTNGVKIFSSSAFVKLGVLNITGAFGPILTSKNVNMEDKYFNCLRKVKNWKYTLGDLELF